MYLQFLRVIATVFDNTVLRKHPLSAYLTNDRVS